MCKITYNNIPIDESTLPEYEVGKTHEIKFEIYNDYDSIVHYEVTSLKEGVKIISSPDKLDIGGIGKIVIEFSPDKNLRESFISSMQIKEIFK